MFSAPESMLFNTRRERNTGSDDDLCHRQALDSVNFQLDAAMQFVAHGCGMHAHNQSLLCGPPP